MPARSTISVCAALEDLTSCPLFHSLAMRPPPAGFCKPSVEVRGRGPGPAGLGVHGGAKNLSILFAFAFRPGFDEHEQLGTRYPMSELEGMGGLPFLARPGG